MALMVKNLYFKLLGMSGFEGQWCLINHKYNLVMVRTGYTTSNYDYIQFFNKIINAIK